MKHLLALTLLCALSQSIGADTIPPPSSYWGEALSTRAYSARHEGGACLQWYVREGDFYEAEGACVDWTAFPGNFADLAYMTHAEKDAWWRAEVTRPLIQIEQELWESLLVHKPLSVYAVAKDGTKVTRPTYPVVNGVRKTTSNGRVAVGTTCRYSVQKIGAYGDVSGQLNWTNGQPLPANTVALCAER